MQLTLPAFKKASKRYAIAAGKNVSAAQDEFSTFFGFTDFHAARGLLSRAPKAARAVEDSCWAYSGPRLLEVLEHNKQQCSPSVRDAATARAYGLLDALVASMIADATGPFAIQELYDALSLKAIEKRYEELYKQYDGSSASWPRVHRPLGRYLELGLPGFRLVRLGDQSEECHLQHSHLLPYIVRVLDGLDALERSASAAA